jgi:hypothetical protein
VRYRYDAQQQKRVKTVELIVEERAWEPCSPQQASESLVRLRVAGPEVAGRQPVKRAGGKGQPQPGVWKLRYDLVVALGLEGRIVADGASIYE